MSVLVIDDHKLLADSVMQALRLKGFETDTVHPTDRTVILDAAARFSPQVALLDLELGSTAFSGFDLIGPLTAFGIAVVVLTAAKDRLETAASLESGAAGVVCKSEPFTAVVRAVELAARGQGLHDPVERDQLQRELREHRSARAGDLAPFDQLSAREREVLAALVDGQSANTIAATSFVSISTVRSQIRAVLQKLDVNSQLEAVAAATRNGWSPDDTLLVRQSSTLTP